MSEDLTLITRKDEILPKPDVRSAEHFVSLLGEGLPLLDAAEETGLSETHKEVRKTLQRLGVYAKLDLALFRRIAEASLQEIILLGEPRDKIGAFAKLYPGEPQAQVEIHLSTEVSKMDVSLPGLDPEEKGEK